MPLKNLLSSFTLECPGCETELTATVNSEYDDYLLYDAECKNCQLSVQLDVRSQEEEE
jgi:hypothetical protein